MTETHKSASSDSSAPAHKPTSSESSAPAHKSASSAHKSESSEPAHKAPAAELGSASESSDGAVQQLAAARHIHVMNGDTEAADAITAELAKLGLK